jgi:DNA repair protein RecN (Recombination protein N)
MLTLLSVRDFAVVRELTVAFAPGLSVVTGETGAGKSIMLDALGLALGDRATSEAIRPGAARAEISAEFALDGIPEVRQWLHEHELDDADDPGHLRVRRTLSPDGRSRAYVNGRAVNVQDLADLGEWLADIHGQHAHQSLLRRPVQLALLDAHADAAELAREVRQRWTAWQASVAALRALRVPDADGEELEWLAFQLRELEALALSADAYDALSDEHRRLAGSDALRAAVERAGELLQGGEPDAHGMLLQAIAQLRGLRHADATIDAAIASLQDLAAAVADIGRDLHRHQATLRPDPERLAEIDDLLARIHAAARKHRVAPNELFEVQERLEGRRAARLDAENARPRLQAEVEAARAAFEEAAAQLGARRRAAAQPFAEAVGSEIRRLGMPHARFEVRFIDEEGAHGTQTLEFVVGTNPELPPGPLQRVASGGELSRISLAIQTVAAARSRIPTLVLDEADAGIGGGTAEIVGQTLRRLGRHTQILCVTHVAQVAAQGVQHLRVRKDDSGTHIDTLDATERVHEVARMIGGTRLTDATLARAEEMLRLAAQEDAAAEPATAPAGVTPDRAAGTPPDTNSKKAGAGKTSPGKASASRATKPARRKV